MAEQAPKGGANEELEAHQRGGRVPRQSEEKGPAQSPQCDRFAGLDRRLPELNLHADRLEGLPRKIPLPDRRA